MKNIAAAKLLYRFLILGGLSLCLWGVSARTKEQTQGKSIPIVITDQLSVKAGVIPVYLSCGQVTLSSENTVESFRCKLKNNTSLFITALNAPYSVVLERNGSITKETTNSVVETLIHSDFKDENKMIGPGQEFSFGPPGPISYGNGEIIKSVEIAIDYIQFENGETLGPDKEGSRIVNAMRTGAKKYKRWVQQQYDVHGRSLTALAPDIEDNNAALAGLTDENEKVGATEYRRKLRKLMSNHGPADIKKLLESNQ